MQGFQAFAEDLDRQIEKFHVLVAQHNVNVESPEIERECVRFNRDMQLLFAPERFDLRQAARRLLAFMDLIQQSPRSSLMLHALVNAMAPIMPGVAESLRHEL